MQGSNSHRHGRPTRRVAGALFLALTTLPPAASGAGLTLFELGASGQGNAFAGAAAVAEDAGSLAFNPASMARLPASDTVLVGHLIAPAFDYTDSGSVQRVPGGTVPLLPGAARDADPGQTGLLPGFYHARRLTPHFHAGIAVNTPYGLATKYDPGWVGRYQAVTSRLSTVRVTPSVAWRASEHFVVGAGLSAQYLDAKLSNAIDFTAVCLAATGGAPGACSNAIPGQGSDDGFVESTADDWGFGFSLGLLAEVDEATRVGVAYRSSISHEARGTADFSVPAGISPVPSVQAAIERGFSDDGVRARVTLPDSFSVSAVHEARRDLSVQADATWTGWSSIPRLVLVYDSPVTAGGPSVEELGWRDTWRLSLGVTWRPGGAWTLRAGTAYDEGATPSAELRTPRLPDADRTWFSLGVGYRASARLGIDAGYSHLRLAGASIRRTGNTGDQLNGRYRSSVDLLSIQVRWAP